MFFPENTLVRARKDVLEKWKLKNLLPIGFYMKNNL